MKNKGKSIDQKFRVGGSATIPHGQQSGGIGPDHKMSDWAHHVDRVPTDVGGFDQHTGNANSDPAGSGNDE